MTKGGMRHTRSKTTWFSSESNSSAIFCIVLRRAHWSNISISPFEEMTRFPSSSNSTPSSAFPPRRLHRRDNLMQKWCKWIVWESYQLTALARVKVLANGLRLTIGRRFVESDVWQQNMQISRYILGVYKYFLLGRERDECSSCRMWWTLER